MRLPPVVFLAALVISASAMAPRDQAPQPAPGQPAPGQPTAGKPAPPPRTPPRAGRPDEPPPTGTAVIRGFVTASDTGTALRRAQVRAFSSDGRGGGVAQTDAQGRYEIKDLPAGRYTLSATKSGYVSMQYGQRRPGNAPGTPLEIADTQIAEKVSFALPRGAAVGGRIVDEFGEPVSTVQVMAARYMFQAGSRRLVQAGAEGGSDRTDDQGSYRLYGLPPGEYYITASLRNMSMNFGPAQVSQGPMDGYAPTYYPGTTSLGEAQRVTVRAAQDLQNVSFALAAARLSRVSGRALNASGEPMIGAQVMAQSRDSNMAMAMMMRGSSMVRPDGTFQISGLAPGSYTLNVQPMRMGPNVDPNPEIGRLDVTVSGGDLENLLIVAARGGIVRGHVVTDDGTPPPFKPQQFRVFANPADPDQQMFGGGSQPKVNDDFTFEITGLADRVLIMASVDAMGGSWSLKHVFREGTDLIDRGLDVPPGTVVEDIQLVLTQQVTELSGAVTDDRNRPVTDATVIIFPADRELWRLGSRRLRIARPDTEGKYRMRIVPGEDYLVIAVQNLEQGQQGDPEFLDRAREAAARLSINEGEKKVLDVKLSSLQP